jgi:hypothetical protein
MYRRAVWAGWTGALVYATAGTKRHAAIVSPIKGLSLVDLKKSQNRDDNQACANRQVFQVSNPRHR